MPSLNYIVMGSKRNCFTLDWSFPGEISPACCQVHRFPISRNAISWVHSRAFPRPAHECQPSLRVMSRGKSVGSAVTQRHQIIEEDLWATVLASGSSMWRLICLFGIVLSLSWSLHRLLWNSRIQWLVSGATVGSKANTQRGLWNADVFYSPCLQPLQRWRHWVGARVGSRMEVPT